MTSKHDLLPFMNLNHLRTLTDDTGILQHSVYHIPQRSHGYCTDDNARALIAVLLARRYRPAAYLDLLSGRYLSFLEHAFNRKTGRFRNFMSFDRRWLEECGSEDSHGRAVWALGAAAGCTSLPGLAPLASHLFIEAIPGLLDLESPRAWAFGLNGLCLYLRRRDADPLVRESLESLAGRLLCMFRRNGTEAWPWLEDCLTYSNGKIPQALISTGRLLRDRELLDCGLQSLRWLMTLQMDSEGHFTPVGNKGWCSRGGARARFDQQPVEAQVMTDACLSAFEATGDSDWAHYARCAFDWFLGRNDLGLPLYDESTGGCRDGLEPDRVNQNEGAEATLSWLIALLRMLSLPG